MPEMNSTFSDWAEEEKHREETKKQLAKQEGPKRGLYCESQG